MVATRAEDTHPANPSHLAIDSLPAPGATIGRYTVIDKVGAGGMGVVYRAHDPSLDREVAIKLVRPARMRGKGGPQHKARLLREARALAQLQHQNVIRIYDVGEHGDALFFAMEFVRGRDARQWLAVESPPWTRIVGVYRAAGRGLSAAHTAGLVHRDFKPANILVGDDHRVRVLDFGLARDADDLRSAGVPSSAAQREASDAVTTDGVVVGTPAYMAPEQLAGLPADARSDQYSFCLSLWESLFGALPFAGNDAKSLAFAKASGEIEEPPAQTDVPPALVDALCRGLAVRPDKRFASMPDLLRTLRGIAEAAEAEPATPVPTASSTALPWIAFGVSAAVALALWARTPDPAACEVTDDARALRDAYRQQVATGQLPQARELAAKLSAHWHARGCRARADDWSALSGG